MSANDQLEELLGQYWDAAWLEGKGEATCIDPNYILHQIRELFNADRTDSFGAGDGCASGGGES